MPSQGINVSLRSIGRAPLTSFVLIGSRERFTSSLKPVEESTKPIEVTWSPWLDATTFPREAAQRAITAGSWLATLTPVRRVTAPRHATDVTSLATDVLVGVIVRVAAEKRTPQQTPHAADTEGTVTHEAFDSVSQERGPGIARRRCTSWRHRSDSHHTLQLGLSSVRVTQCRSHREYV